MTSDQASRNPVLAVSSDAPILWLTDWDAALAQARATRRPLLIDVWKDP
jgi:hypothetical protein